MDHNQANVYLFKVNNRNTRKKFEISSKLIKTLEQCHWRISCVSIVDFEQINVNWIVFESHFSKVTEVEFQRWTNVILSYMMQHDKLSKLRKAT